MEKISPKSERLERLAEEWKTFGKRPRNIEPPTKTEESVWDYPRPPSIELVTDHFQVLYRESVILNCQRAIRICETASAPTYYFYPEDFQCELVQTKRESYCEWKGHATYWTGRIKTTNSETSIPDAFWSYESPYDEYHI